MNSGFLLAREEREKPDRSQPFAVDGSKGFALLPLTNFGAIRGSPLEARYENDETLRNAVSREFQEVFGRLTLPKSPCGVVNYPLVGEEIAT